MRDLETLMRVLVAIVVFCLLAMPLAHANRCRGTPVLPRGCGSYSQAECVCDNDDCHWIWHCR
jgi:hypothetical protein